MFGKKPQGHTALIVDVENGSVGAALLHQGNAGQAPRLFGETRVHLPIHRTRDSGAIAKSIEKAARESLEKVSLVAARLRTHAKTESLGTLSRAHIFLSAPWGIPNVQSNKPQLEAGMRGILRDEVAAFMGDIPTRFSTSADAAVYGLNTVAPHDEAFLVMVRGEVAEVILLTDGVAGFATVPHGHHMLLRTINTHAGLTHSEARSALALREYAPHLDEPLSSAAEHFSEAFAEVAHELLHYGSARQIVVLSDDKNSTWFAKALSQSPHVHDLFPQGGEVRSLSAQHVSPYVEAHSRPHDLFLMLSALFASGRVGIY